MSIFRNEVKCKVSFKTNKLSKLTKLSLHLS